MSFVGLTLIPIRLRIFRREPSANGGREAGGAGAADERAAAAVAAASSSMDAAETVAAEDVIGESVSGLMPPATAVDDSLSAIARKESICYFFGLVKKMHRA